MSPRPCGETDGPLRTFAHLQNGAPSIRLLRSLLGIIGHHSGAAVLYIHTPLLDGSYYVGQTDDLARRLVEHEAGATGGYTAFRRPVRLVWSQEFSTREEAKAAEAQIKKWSRRKKEALLSGRKEELRTAARKDWRSYRQRRADERGRAQ